MNLVFYAKIFRVGIFLPILTLPLERNPLPPVSLPLVKLFDVEMCWNLPPDCLCSAGIFGSQGNFISHDGGRQIILATECVIDSGFSIHLRPAYPLPRLRAPCPLPPALRVNPSRLSLCPLITTAFLGGAAARVPRGEAAGSGGGAGFARTDSRYMVEEKKKARIPFSCLSKPHSVCYWLWMMEIDPAFDAYLILPIQVGRNYLSSSPGVCCLDEQYSHIYQYMRNWFAGQWRVDEIEIVADLGAATNRLFAWEASKVQKPNILLQEEGIHAWPGQSHCELSLNMCVWRLKCLVI